MADRNWSRPPQAKDGPDFENLLAVLQRQTPKRPTMFELFLNDELYGILAADTAADAPENMAGSAWTIAAMRNAGYDYIPGGIPGFHFDKGERAYANTYSLNEGAVIGDRKDFDAYNWPDVERTHHQELAEIEPLLPAGMKVLAAGPCGVLENVIGLVGYESLCMMIMDNEQLAYDIFEAVGSRLVAYYTKAVSYSSVGGIIGNDDWGFKSQTMLSPADMRRFVFPWHRDLVAAAHAAGKPAILHSCGNRQQILDDICDEIQYDGVHSYEDTIQPVEDAYDQYGDRTAIIGGIDVDFMVRRTPEEIYERSKAMLEKTSGTGGYALGSGNSIAPYIPHANYFAMVQAALDARCGANV
ncbi:MAG: uroporphyrinogen decarboxylase family protein [Planctomycetota bacterium]|jgi:uroporphyrinogen decarboxylase